MFKFSKVLERGSAYLKKELRDKGILTDSSIEELRKEILVDQSDLIPQKLNCIPENYERVTGEWIQQPTFM